MKAPGNGGGRDDVSSVPASVAAGEGMSPHVRVRLSALARECVRSAERGEMTGAALSLLSDLAALGVRAGGVAA